MTVVFTLLAIASVSGADVAVHSSGRYYQDSSGKPMFLIGYYGWAAVPDGYYINDAGMYSSMMNQGGSYKINYIRISLGVNHMTGSTNPPVYPGGAGNTPVPFLYNGSGKAVLSSTTALGNPSTIQWDPVFWNGLAAQCALAKQNGVIAHISIFDGVELRDQGGASYGYNNNYWNPSCQDKAYYPGGYYGDGGGGFYRLADFNSNTGIGYYQKAMIDKTCQVLAPYDNVIIEVGNELLGSDSAWNTAVIAYIKTKTSKPVTTVGNNGTGLQGYSDHIDDTIAELKASLSSMVGHGYPAWVDPDGSQIEFLDPDGIRNCYWYAFCSGAAAYGGFTCDFWTWPVNPPPGFNTLKATYCKYLQNFLTDSAVQFGTMTPQQSLISNSSLNLCLASTGVEYVGYVLSDATATLNLSGISGAAKYQLFNPKTGVYTAEANLTGGGTSSFTRPNGWSDWVIHVYTGGSRPQPTEQTLLVQPAGAITVDGNPAEWNTTACQSTVHAGIKEHGTLALTGFDNGTLYRGAFAGVLPTSPSDHTAKVYSRHDSSYLYFLVRCDDDDLQYSTAVGSNWANDCVEFYLDPGNTGGSTAIANSTSDIQLVIDANNQKNVYCTTPGYATQVLSGLTSAVVRDSTGWWLEARLAKNVLAPALPASGKIGLDFNYRDNDNANDGTRTTVYTWAETSTAGFPSKIPDHWGKAFLGTVGVTPYPGPSAASLPGRIEAENYDNGGEGAGYHDTTSGNTGGVYRTDGVDIQAASDAGGGYCVGYMETGEWLSYTANVATAGNYNIKVRVATPNSGCTFHIEMDGQDVTGTQNIVSTSGYQNWNTMTIPSIYMGACQHWLKLVVDSGGFNVNYIDVQTITSCQAGDPFELAPVHSIGSGQTPAVATDSVGNLHIVYTSGGTTITYKKYSADNLNTPQISETIPAPAGHSNFTNPHIAIDSSDAPHLVFCQGFTYSPAVWYTNRIGGSWKTPFSAMTSGTPTDSVTRYPRIVLAGSYAFISSMLWLGNDGGHVWGRIVRLSNLSGTPSVTASAEPQYLRCTIAANGAGNICASGRNDANGHYFQEYDQNLNPVGSMVEWSVGKAGKTNSPAGICSGPDGTVHMFTDASYASPDICQMIYNNTSRRTGGAFQNCIRGLNGGAPGTGPDPAGEIQYNSGWWNDEVWPVAAVDTIGRVYVAYTGWTNLPLKGRITTVSSSGFTEPPVDFTTDMYYQAQQYNCEIAPGHNGGVFVVWQGAGADGNSPLYVRGIGVGSACNQAPSSPTQFAAAAASGQVGLSWVNPGDTDFVGTIIRYRTDTYPASATDGNLVCDRAAAPGSTDLYIHTGLTNGVTYYYSAFAYDRQPLYSDPAVASSAPHPLPDWLNEVFNGYSNGDLGGQGGWSTLSRSGQVEDTVAKGGTGKAALFDSLGQNASIGNQITVTDKTTGLIDFSFDVREDAAGTTGQEFGTVNLYGSDSAVPICKVHIQKSRMFLEYSAGSGSLATISTNVVSGTWYNVKLSLNVDTKKIDAYLDGVSKGTNLGWAGAATRMSRILISTDKNTNLTQQQLYIDNVRLEPKPGQVTAVTDDGTWSPSLSKLHFTFPAVAGTPEYQYAIGTTSGGTQTRGWTSCGTSTDVTATGLSLTESTTITYYVSVQCLTQFGSAGASRTSNGIKVALGVASINAAKALADGTAASVRSLRGKLVSAVFPGYFYIQEPGGPFGMKVISSATVASGDQVDVAGFMQGSALERFIDCTGNGVIKAAGSGGPNPVVLRTSLVGGIDLNANTHGIVSGIGPHSVGLYVYACGTVTQRQAGSYFYIDDGSGVKDGTLTGGVENVGVRVSADPASYPAGSYVGVTGVVSCFNGGGIRPQLLPAYVQLLQGP